MNNVQDNKGSERKENTWLADRSAGIFILLLSSGAAVGTIILPLMGMLQQNEDVLFSTNLIALTILGFLFGLAYSVFGGENLNKLSNPVDKKGVTRLIIFSIGFLAILFGLMAVWSSVVNTLGYG